MNIYCPRKKGGKVDVLACIYHCSKSTVIQCPEYNAAFPELRNYQIPEQYLAKYGPKEIIVPLKYWRRRQRASP